MAKIGQTKMSGDASLIQAAHRMGMAGVPKDLSRVHERIAKSYTRAMEGIGRSRAAMIGALEKAGTKLVEEAIKSRNDNTDKQWEHQTYETTTPSYDMDPDKDDIPIGVDIDVPEIGPQPEVKQSDTITDSLGNTKSITFLKL